MMQVVRFLALLAVTFAGGYFGVSWFSRGAPAPGLVFRPPEPIAHAPTFRQVRDGIGREGAPPKTLQSDGDADRDAMRLSTLQAADAFVLSPCDPTIKANLVKALSAYAKDYADKSGCSGRSCGGEARVTMAAQLFSTPLDKKVRESVENAFAAGGLRLDDFPRPLHLSVTLLSRGADEGEQTCGASRPHARR